MRTKPITSDRPISVCKSGLSLRMFAEAPSVDSIKNKFSCILYFYKYYKVRECIQYQFVYFISIPMDIIQ